MSEAVHQQVRGDEFSSELHSDTNSRCSNDSGLAVSDDSRPLWGSPCKMPSSSTGSTDSGSSASDIECIDDACQSSVGSSGADDACELNDGGDNPYSQKERPVIRFAHETKKATVSVNYDLERGLITAEGYESNTGTSSPTDAVEQGSELNLARQSSRLFNGGPVEPKAQRDEQLAARGPSRLVPCSIIFAPEPLRTITATAVKPEFQKKREKKEKRDEARRKSWQQTTDIEGHREYDSINEILQYIGVKDSTSDGDKNEKNKNHKERKEKKKCPKRQQEDVADGSNACNVEAGVYGHDLSSDETEEAEIDDRPSRGASDSDLSTNLPFKSTVMTSQTINCSYNIVLNSHASEESIPLILQDSSLSDFKQVFKKKPTKDKGKLKSKFPARKANHIDDKRDVIPKRISAATNSAAADNPPTAAVQLAESANTQYDLSELSFPALPSTNQSAEAMQQTRDSSNPICELTENQATLASWAKVAAKKKIVEISNTGSGQRDQETHCKEPRDERLSCVASLPIASEASSLVSEMLPHKVQPSIDSLIEFGSLSTSDEILKILSERDMLSSSTNEKMPTKERAAVIRKSKLVSPQHRRGGLKGIEFMDESYRLDVPYNGPLVFGFDELDHLGMDEQIIWQATNLTTQSSKASDQISAGHSTNLLHHLQHSPTTINESCNQSSFNLKQVVMMLHREWSEVKMLMQKCNDHNGSLARIVYWSETLMEHGVKLSDV